MTLAPWRAPLAALLLLQAGGGEDLAKTDDWFAGGGMMLYLFAAGLLAWLLFAWMGNRVQRRHEERLRAALARAVPRRDLIRRIAELDLAFERGQLAGADWADERAALLERLLDDELARRGAADETGGAPGAASPPAEQP